MKESPIIKFKSVEFFLVFSNEGFLETPIENGGLFKKNSLIF